MRAPMGYWEPRHKSWNNSTPPASKAPHNSPGFRGPNRAPIPTASPRALVGVSRHWSYSRLAIPWEQIMNSEQDLMPAGGRLDLPALARWGRTRW
jgi:hypothetical protein